MPRKSISKTPETLDRDLRAHLKCLGLTSVTDYQAWCVQHGFSKKLNKHWKQRCRERFHVQEAVARKRLDQNKREKRNLLDVIEGICQQRLGVEDVSQPHLKRLCEQVSGAPRTNRRALRSLLTHLHRRRAELFVGGPVIAELGDGVGNSFIEALALLARHWRSWARPVEDWKPRSHSARRQFGSLLRHLLVQYDMPLFFDSVWFTGESAREDTKRTWYLNVARGQSIRHCRLPISYTKRMAHHFMQAPSDVTVDGAIRWGQVLGLGGDQRLARALIATRLTDDFSHDDFWSSVIRWFATHSMLDMAAVGPIVDYLHNQRFVPDVGDERPPQPGLSMRGRTPASVLRQVQAWHRMLASDNTKQVGQWNPSGIDEFEFQEGLPGNENHKRWTIRELLSSKALMAEGRQLKHCVATYASSCARGSCSIWTMEVESAAGRQKVLTIEVRGNTRLICQVRGKANRLATEKEQNVIRRWATASRLRVRQLTA